MLPVQSVIIAGEHSGANYLKINPKRVFIQHDVECESVCDKRVVAFSWFGRIFRYLACGRNEIFVGGAISSSNVNAAFFLLCSLSYGSVL